MEVSSKPVIRVFIILLLENLVRNVTILTRIVTLRLVATWPAGQRGSKASVTGVGTHVQHCLQ